MVRAFHLSTDLPRQHVVASAATSHCWTHDSTTSRGRIPNRISFTGRLLVLAAVQFLFSTCAVPEPRSCVRHLELSMLVNPTLRLRGGHRMPNEKKRNALEQHRTSRRIHSVNRPRDQKRRQEKWEAFNALKEEVKEAPVNLTEVALNMSKPKLRVWEATVGQTMNKIHEFKKRCPEVWAEEERCRFDQVANFAIGEWREILAKEAREDEETDRVEAFRRRQDLTWQKQKAIAHYNLAMCWEIGYGVEGVDIGRAFQHYKAAAELGHPEGMCNLGCCYLSGHGCAYNEARGFVWTQKAAEAGSFEGQLNLGLCYRRGVGVVTDPAAAVRWMNASACNRHPDGMYAIAMCHQQGYGPLPANPALAVAQLSRVIDKYQHAPSYLSLGQCFLRGHGVSVDREMGLKLVAEAAKLGMAEANEMLEQGLGGGVGIGGGGDSDSEP